MTTPVIDLEDTLEQQCMQIWAATTATKRAERRAIREPATVRVWDGEWKLHHLLKVEDSAEFEFVENDTGPGVTVMPFHTPIGLWLKDMKGRIERGEKRNVHITVDKMGGRWGGRLTDVTVEETEIGDQILTATWANDYEELKYYTVRSNPLFPAAFQFPKVWMLPGPARWAVLTTLFFQLLRDNLNLWTIPDDPLDPDEWGTLDMSKWPIVCKPLSFGEDLAAGTVWAMPISRWQNYHQVVKAIMDDAELTFVLRRYLTGDPPPWPGANLRNGCLVVSIEDNSGVAVGTAHGGSLADGLVRTIAEFTEDLLDSTLDVVGDFDVPAQYLIPGYKLTVPRTPYAVYRPGISPGVLSAKFIDTPATAIAVGTGGHSMPGVNELISAGVQAAGDIVGNLLQVGSIGGSVDTLLKPFYEDSIAAWMWTKNFFRSSNSGWSRYYEIQQDGADKAYTLSALMVLRTGMWATRTWFSHEIQVLDQSPYIIGDQGVGHLWLGSRIGVTLPGDPTGEIKVDRVKKLVLGWDRDTFDNWKVTVGDDKKNVDPAVAAMQRIRDIFGALHDQGVM